MGHTWKNELHLETWVTLHKISQIWRNGSNLKWVKIGEIGHPCEKGSHLEKWVTLVKMGLI